MRHGNARFYDGEACRRVEMILRGKRLGYTLTAIAGMLSRTADFADPEFLAAPGEVEAQIDRLERRRVELDGAIADLQAIRSRLKEAPQAHSTAA